MTQKTQDYLVSQIRSGNIYIYSKRQDLVQDDTAYYFIENPEDNGVIEIESFGIVAGTKTNVNMHTNVSETSPGDSMHLINSRIGSPEDISLERRYGGSYTDLDTDPFEDVIPAGEGGNGSRANVVGGKSADMSLSIPPGENILFEFVNVSSSDGYVAPRFIVNYVG